MSVHVTSRVWKHAAVGGSPLICLLALADRSDDVGVSWMGTETIAGPNYCRMSPRHMIRILDALVRDGEIVIIQRPGRSSIAWVVTGLSDKEIRSHIKSHDYLKQFREFWQQELDAVLSRLSAQRNRRKMLAGGGGDNLSGVEDEGVTHVSGPGVTHVSPDPSFDPPITPNGVPAGAGQQTLFGGTPSHGRSARRPAGQEPLKLSTRMKNAFTAVVEERGWITNVGGSQQVIATLTELRTDAEAYYGEHMNEDELLADIAQATRAVMKNYPRSASERSVVRFDRIPSAVRSLRTTRAQEQARQAQRPMTWEEIDPALIDTEGLVD